MLKFYCQEKNIKIRYTILYMYKKNEMTKRYWKTLAIIKDILLMNNSFSINFWTKFIDTSNYLWNKLFIKYSKCTIILKNRLELDKM